MDNPVPSLVLIVGIKCMLNWAVVLGQRRHMVRSFLGLFCISLALMDTFLALAFLAIYGLEDFQLLGLRFTNYHICLLVQIVCFTYGLLHWPVFFLTGLDHYWTLWPSPQPLCWARRLVYAFGVCGVWALDLLYVFVGSDFQPDVGEVFPLLLRQCPVFSSPQSTQVSATLLLTVGCALLCCGLESLRAKEGGPDMPWLDGQCSRHVLCLTVDCFLSTWSPFVIFQMALLLLWAEIPAYLDMNVPWLCFLNSFLIGALSWTRFRTTRIGNHPSFTDGFCDWHFGPDSAEANEEGGTASGTLKITTPETWPMS